jgi:hypothetical protein
VGGSPNACRRQFLGAKHQIAATFVGYSVGFPGIAAYAASKSGLIGLTQALAAEFGPSNIRVNAILPRAVDTPMYRDMNNTPEAQSQLRHRHGDGRRWRRLDHAKLN